MTYKPWTPVIVGETDCVSNDTSPVDNQGPLNFVFRTNEDGVVITTAEELTCYMNVIANDQIDWIYDVVHESIYGYGQFVSEIKNEKIIQMYWIPSKKH